jgi:hypothetical protein
LKLDANDVIWLDCDDYISIEADSAVSIKTDHALIETDDSFQIRALNFAGRLDFVSGASELSTWNGEPLTVSSPELHLQGSDFYLEVLYDLYMNSSHCTSAAGFEDAYGNWFTVMNGMIID